MDVKHHYIKFVLSLIKHLLDERNVKLSNNMDDGRINSIHDEDIIANYLIERLHYVIKKGKSRELGDIWINMQMYDCEDFPVNIKCINEKPGQRNNLVGLPRFIAHTFDDKSCKTKVGVAKTLKVTEKDKILNKYGLIFVSKDSMKSWVGTLDEVPDSSIHINPSNDFQLSWPSCLVNRTNEEYREMLTNKLYELFRKWAEPLKVFESL